uniref:DDE_Tnp_1_7 domain-containing protein n=1 Tax=Glossina pallidipes TaxID=7398 RepID=A0A1A9Z398_GLOPL
MLQKLIQVNAMTSRSSDSVWMTELIKLNHVSANYFFANESEVMCNRFFSKKEIKSMEYGVSLTLCTPKGNITLLAWKDKRVVTLLSTWNNTGTTSTKRYIRGGSAVVVSKPNVVLDYTHSMGGVDRAFQYGSTYCFLRKSLKWWRNTTEVHFSDAPTQKYHGVVALLMKIKQLKLLEKQKLHL